MRFPAGLLLMMMASGATAAEPWVTYPGPGKKVVLISGDEEYRSEETLTQLGRILSRRHGYHCTVHFAINPKTGTIDPNVRTNIPGLEALTSADLMVIFTRYRNLSDDQMQHIVAYVDSGRPIIGMRTATHGFAIKPGRIYSRFGDGSREWPGGFGKQVLGENWIDHHGDHGKEGTRGRLAPGAAGHPILRGIADGAIFGTSDVYTVNLPLAGDSVPLVLGEVTETLDPASQAVAGKKNDPMMPIAWTRTYSPPGKSPVRVFTTTLGASQDFASAGTRRLLVNAAYWAVGDEAKIPAESDVELVGEFTPSPFRTDGFKKGVTPESLKLPDGR